MCVIFFAYKKHDDFPLVFLANRDEFYDRPTAKAEYWKDHPQIYGGRDLVAGGTWLGITKNGKFGAVTNYRDPSQKKGKVSRGDLVADFLKTDGSPEKYLQSLRERKDDFTGFNLLIGEVNRKRNELFYFSNRDSEIRRLSEGIYGLSNHILETPWKKVKKGKARLTNILAGGRILSSALFEILADKTLAEDDELPETGIGYEREKLLSSIFIETPIYGTRSSTVIIIDSGFKIDFEERVVR